jgi:hypothetical protein
MSSARNVMQVIGIVCLALLLSIIAHKAYTDISVLAHKHSGSEFWVALGRYLLANIAG